MSIFIEGNLKFSFPNHSVAKYDDWSFYRNQLTNSFGGTKAVDFLYLSEEELWLIEVKDFRREPRKKEIDLDDEISLKVRDSLVGLFCAKNLANCDVEKEFARKCLKAKRFNIVLHIEQPDKTYPGYHKIINIANLKLKLEQKIKRIGKVIVVSKDRMHSKIEWDVKDN